MDSFLWPMLPLSPANKKGVFNEGKSFYAGELEHFLAAINSFRQKHTTETSAIASFVIWSLAEQEKGESNGTKQASFNRVTMATGRSHRWRSRLSVIVKASQPASQPVSHGEQICLRAFVDHRAEVRDWSARSNNKQLARLWARTSAAHVSFIKIHHC